MFSTDIFCLLFSIEAWLNQHMQNSQIHSASTLGFLIRGILDAPPSFFHMPGSSSNSENLKGHIPLQERTCHGLIIFSPLLDGPRKNYVKPNLFHPMRRDCQ